PLMFRKLTAVALLLGVAAAVTAETKVYYYARVTAKYQDVTTDKKDLMIEGTVVEESKAGVKIKTKAKKEVLIAPDDVAVMEYDVGTKLVSEFRTPLHRIRATIENKDKKLSKDDQTKALNKDLDLLKDLHKKLDGNPKTYIEYKIAETTVLLAQMAERELRTAKRDEAIKLLSTFATAHPVAWTIVPALKTLARLQEEAGQTDDARATYDKLANVLPAEQRRESDLLVGRLLLRGGKYEDAETRLSGVLKNMSD